MLYDEFKPVVDLVLNNWTALQLAVEHGMGAPGGEKTAQLMSVYVARYCVENVVCIDDLTEVLEDLMDEEFDTVCHDNSPKEIAILLINYLTMLKEGRHDEVQALIAAMPPSQRWLSQPMYSQGPPQYRGNPDDGTSSSDDNEDEPNAGNTSNRHFHPEGHNIFVHVNKPPDYTAEEANGQTLDEAAGFSQNGMHAQASSSQDEPMDEDEEPAEPGWTVVRTRRKK